MQSYAVYWNDLDGARFAGRFSLGASSADVDGGSSDGRHTRQNIAFADITAVRYERGRLSVWLTGGSALLFGSVDGPGALRELAELLQSVLTAAANV